MSVDVQTGVFEIDDLNTADYNPRREMTANEMSDLIASIEENGYVEAIVVNKNGNVVVGGHQRIAAMRKLGVKSVEAIVVDLDKNAEKELNVALNRIDGGWEPHGLANLLAELDSQGEAAHIGFSSAEIEELVKSSDWYREHLFDAAKSIDDIELRDNKRRCPKCGHVANAMAFSGH